MLSLTIKGVVQDAETELPVGEAVVELRDAEREFESLAQGTSDAFGQFQLVAEVDRLEDPERFIGARTQVVVDVYAPHSQRLTLSSEPFDPWRPVEDLVLRIPEGQLRRPERRPVVRLLGDDGGERDVYGVGDSLVLEVVGVRPAAVHDVVLRDGDGEELFTSRLLADATGRIEPTVVWPQLGLADLRSTELLTLEDAEERWRGRRLVLEVRLGESVIGAAEAAIADSSEQPQLFVVDAEGRAINGFERGEQDVYLEVRNVAFDVARVHIVRRQANWQPGDRFEPVMLESGRSGYTDLQLTDDRRSHRTRIARARELSPGAYDLIMRGLRYGYEDDEDFVLRHSDLVAHRLSTGLVVREPFMASKAVLGGCVNYLQIAGRSIFGAPYFQYADTFQVGESVYGALDPAALAPNQMSKMVALYVVANKSAADWSVDKSLNHLAVLGGNVAVQKFLTQAGCINYNKRLLWANASAGEYDVIADFGNNTANPATFAPDNSLDAPLDIIDGYFVAGFRVVVDPTTDTSFTQAGQFQYDQSTEGSVTVTDDFGSSWIVPLKAIVYFPADVAGATNPSQISAAQANYPLVVIVHGNSTSTTSYLGYNYLLEHLAKNGFIAASIHLEVCQLATDRARVLLAHLTKLKTKFGAKAANNIGLVGHSRGGEAVTIAARLNNQQSLGHGINAVIPLAPSDWIAHETFSAPWAVPYLVIYGALDGDIAGGPPLPMETGFAMYDRASGADKAMVFAYGCIHDHFNTVWGDGDLYFGQIGATDLPKVATADAHQKLAKGYMTAFFRQHLKGEAQWEGMFRGEWVPTAVATADPGKLALYVQYVDTSKSVVDDFEGVHTATSWETSTIGGAVADDSSLPVDPTEDNLWTVDAHSPHQTAGLLLRWDGLGDRLRFDIPPASKNVSTYSHFSFRVTQKVDSASNPAAPQDLYVTLKDTGGKSRSIKVAKFAEIPQPQKRHFNQFTKSAMRTVRIPLHVFTIEVVGTDRVDLATLASVTFDFNALATGEIEIDSVEFTT